MEVCKQRAITEMNGILKKMQPYLFPILLNICICSLKELIRYRWENHTEACSTKLGTCSQHSQRYLYSNRYILEGHFNWKNKEKCTSLQGKKTTLAILNNKQFTSKIWKARAQQRQMPDKIAHNICWKNNVLEKYKLIKLKYRKTSRKLE